MPVVKKVNPLAEVLEPVESQNIDPNLEAVVGKLEEVFSRLNSFKEPMLALDNCIRTLQTFSERLEEVEKSLSNLDLGKAPAIPDSVYHGLSSADIFKTALQGLLVASDRKSTRLNSSH